MERPLLLAAVGALLLAACGGDPAPSPAPLPVAPGPPHAFLGRLPEAAIDLGGELPATGTTFAATIAALAAGADADGLAPIRVDDPLEGSVFPPGFVPPTFLWHDEAAGADTWLLDVAFASGAAGIRVLVPGPPPPRGPIDEKALGETNAVYEPTPYQASARSWTPSRPLWDLLQRRSVEQAATLTILGCAGARPDVPLSRGRVTLSTSKDPVEAPIFYRDVPLMPGKGEKGVIQPLATNAIPLIAWRLRDVTRPESRLVLQGMPACGNCHSFSEDGKTFGMDVDGPQGDKGTYAIKPVSANVRIEHEDVITWNSFPGKPPGHRTIGFLSRVSPDGRHVASTVNESLYVANFLDYRCLQVFYPTRGIIAIYDTQTATMRALPGADDPAFVHGNPVWSPDGAWLVLSRASAFDPYAGNRPLATHPNDPNEPPIRYDLVRIPFRGGQGGPPEPIAGASGNGASNTFPKVSPDGRWIVFTRCRNGLLLRPDGRLWIVPFAGGEAREMRCNRTTMNSWHSWSPNGRWLVFSSKHNTPYTQMFLTHVDEQGHDTPAILVPDSTAANRAVNIPEFLNAPYDALQSIDVPAVHYQRTYWDAVDRLRERDLDEARRLLELTLQEEPDFRRAHVNLGLVLMEQGRMEEAREHYEQALALEARDFVAHNGLGLVLEALGRPDDATRHFEAALREEPSLAHAHRNLARVLGRQGRREEAAAHLDRLRDALPEDPGSRWALVGAYVDARLAGGAIRELEAMAEQAPDDPKVLTSLAWILATSPEDDVRDGARAAAAARRAVAASGGARPEPLDALAAALAEQGRFAEAVEVIEQALTRLADPDDRLAKSLAARLERYRQGEPYRTP